MFYFILLDFKNLSRGLLHSESFVLNLYINESTVLPSVYLRIMFLSYRKSGKKKNAGFI